jgi:hypothetical protein
VAGQSLGVEPDAQDTLALAEKHYLGHSCHARQFVLDLDGRIVAEIKGVKPAIRRGQDDEP